MGSHTAGLAASRRNLATALPNKRGVSSAGPKLACISLKLELSERRRENRSTQKVVCSTLRYTVT